LKSSTWEAEVEDSLGYLTRLCLKEKEKRRKKPKLKTLRAIDLGG
jgi:hypothetical protein